MTIDEAALSEDGIYPIARWSATDGQRAVDAWRSSGLTRAAWCQQAGVAEHRLGYWLAKSAPAPLLRSDVAGCDFVQLTRASMGGDTRDGVGCLRATLPSGVCLQLLSALDLEVFVRAVRALS